MEMVTYAPSEAPMWARPTLQLCTMSDAAAGLWWWQAPVQGEGMQEKMMGAGPVPMAPEMDMADLALSMARARQEPMF